MVGASPPRALHAGGVVVALLFARLAHADSEGQPRVTLRYEAPPAISGCPPDAVFREAVQRRLTFDPFGPDAVVLVATRITDERTRLRASITLLDARDGELFSQEIEAGRGECAALGAAAALAVAIAIERWRQTSASEAVKPVSSDRQQAPPPPSLLARRAPAVPAPRPLPRELRGDTHAGARVSRGFIPAVAAGTFFGAAASGRWWRLGLELGAWFPTRVESERGGAARLSLVLGSVQACWRRSLFFACGTVALGRLNASGADLRVPRSASSTFAALGAGLGLDLPLGGPWTLSVDSNVAAPVTRARVNVEERILWQTPGLALEAGLRLRVRIF